MRTGLSLALFLLAGPVLADEIRVESRVEAATVFPDGATVSRQAAFEVPEGRHTLLLSGLLGAGLDGNSLRASGEGDGAFTILAVELREPDPQALQERLRSDRQKWEDARERLEDQKRTAEDTKTAADRQLAFIDAAIRSASVGGEGEAAPTAQDWSALWRDSRAATQEALGMKQRADQLIRQLDRQLAALRPPVGNDGRDVAIAVEIEAAQPVKGSLSVDYFIDDASWYPVYDARLTTGDEPALTLARRAAISQRTAEDWRNVALTLSTARPSGRSEVRLPSSRWLRLVPEQPVALGGVASFGIAPPPPPPPPMGYAEPAPSYPQEDAEMRKATQAVAAIRQLGETVVFEIAARADIPGGGATRRVLIGEEAPEVTLEVRATPVAEEEAYLYAVFTNDASLLLPGEASLSRDGLFIGRVGIDAIASGEEGAIPFGPLESVKVSHRVVEEKDGESFSRPEQTRRYRSEMTVENIGETPRTVRVYAALPQTGTDEIEVTPVISPPVSEEDAGGKTGRVAWVFEIAAGESETVSFGYDIAWPLGRQMLGG